MVDLRRLRYFVAVAEEQHFGRAATRLGISQPPLSEHIQALEAELGSRLLLRTTRSVRLTAEGEALLAHARSILEGVDRCRDVVQAVHRKEGDTLTLGILHAHAYTFLPGLLRAYFAQDPARRVQLVEYSTTEQATRLLEGAIDIGLIREPVYHALLRTQTLFTESYAVALPSSWAMARKSRVSVRDLDGRRMVGYPSHDRRRSTQSLFRDFFHQYGVRPADFLEVRTMHAALALVAAQQGFAPVPWSQTSLRLSGLVYRRFRERPPDLSVGLAWREDKASPATEAFIATCVAYFSRNKAQSVHA